MKFMNRSCLNPKCHPKSPSKKIASTISQNLIFSNLRDMIAQESLGDLNFFACKYPLLLYTIIMIFAKIPQFISKKSLVYFMPYTPKGCLILFTNQFH
jgi:hypothetical protein